MAKCERCHTNEAEYIWKWPYRNLCSPCRNKINSSLVCSTAPVEMLVARQNINASMASVDALNKLMEVI
jgi:hypothetical protein